MRSRIGKAGSVFTQVLADCLPQNRRSGGMSVEEAQDQPFEEQISGTGRAGSGSEPAGRRGYRHRRALLVSGESADDHRRHQCLEVGIAGQDRVQRLQLSGGCQEQGGRIPASSGGKRDLGAQQIRSSAEQLVLAVTRDCTEELRRRFGIACVQFGLGGVQCSLSATRGVRGQFGSACQKCRGGSRATTPAGSLGGLCQFNRDAFIRCDHGVGVMPGPMFLLCKSRDHLCQHPVHVPPLRGRRVAVDGRTDQWVPKAQAPFDGDQTTAFSGHRCVSADVQPIGGAPKPHRVTGGLRGRDEQKGSRGRRKFGQTLAELSLNPLRDRSFGHQGVAAGDGGRSQGTPKLQ